MTYQEYAPGEIGRIGESIYQERIRPLVEEGNKGRFLVMNVETGEYEVGEDRMALSRRFHARQPGAPLYAIRIGYSYASRLGFGPRTLLK